MRVSGHGRDTSLEQVEAAAVREHLLGHVILRQLHVHVLHSRIALLLVGDALQPLLPISVSLKLNEAVGDLAKSLRLD